MKHITPGTFTGKLVDYGIGRTKAGLPQVLLMFAWKDGDGDHHRGMWFGSLRDGRAKEITIDVLLLCGLVGNQLEPVAKGLSAGVLDTEKDLQLVVVEELDDKEKLRTRIKYINEVGGQGFRERMNENEAAQVLGGLSFTADIMARRAATGRTDTSVKVPF